MSNADPKPARLTIDHVRVGKEEAVCIVRLDGEPFIDFVRKSEPEARAAAEKYVAELLEHFRGGGT